ncbi:MAG: 4-hydroxythreonine-4-phosphate dehydrogenase PdxA [Pseudomonadales bacterium]
MSNQTCLRIVVTPGEPAGIGPDICAQISAQAFDYELVAVADPSMLATRAELLGLRLHIEEINLATPSTPSKPGVLKVLPVALTAPVTVGQCNPANAKYVLRCLDVAQQACSDGQAQALVTGPINKAAIIDAGYAFSGHTEYLAQRTGTAQVVMMLASDKFRVALATTHIPLAAVSAALSIELLRDVIRVIAHDLRTRFALADPCILVCGLNPHAGESGHLGSEEQTIIGPCIEELRAQGLRLIGPVPADTAFTPKYLDQCDAVLAMFHDQGLPVIKHASFGTAVNITLGLPIIRTSVDHGTALDIAGSGKADASSMLTALRCAAAMAASQQARQ